MNLRGVFSGMVLLQLVASLTALGQGSLTPPGVPAATMKTLDQIQPRTDVLKLGGDVYAQYVITRPGSYYLSTNIVMVPGFRAIEIKTNDVTLDLSGFTIFGGDTPAIYGGAPVSRIHILNGHLVNCSAGIEFYTSSPATNVVVEDMLISGTNAFLGYGVAAFEGAHVSRCQISGFGGSSGYGILGGDRSVVENCELQNNYVGVALGRLSRVDNCIIQKCNGAGINILDTSIARNNLISLCSPGILCFGNSVVENNNITFCPGAGISANNNYSYLNNNQLLFNQIGINANSGGTNFIVRNTAHGNTNGNYSLGLSASGPVFTGIGVVTNHPWANFSY
ncbi:right-handed parallel beta-helix repeat-containing protein [Pedosphaera parvula]|uniref:Right handed beta helix domain-containing protein n=1 Tax=Pedosphaera parvula (strain Ellin514) TaxID=320771 RepID=B9XLQ0_PEDPL|nr:right-handed parallel beta-helix repeat-containing protein [Pedosphaera parvula]EEF59298.1 hypothetical protein Cflav_PD2149 [Pedosphaera parvula Ellin514]